MHHTAASGEPNDSARDLSGGACRVSETVPKDSHAREAHSREEDHEDRSEPESLLPQSWFVGARCFSRIQGKGLVRRAYLDSAATALPLRPAIDWLTRFLPNHANVHSEGHFAARFSQQMERWARSRILSFFGADPEQYTAIFCGNGTTAAVQRFARKLASSRSERDIVLVSSMEHHSNDLPHRQVAKVVHLPLVGAGAETGIVSLSGLVDALSKYRGRVRYVTVTAASNVTGLINPIHSIAQICHEHDTLFLVDGAAMVAHAPLSMCPTGRETQALDALVFSGHKLHAPMSPGVLLIRRALLEESPPVDFGGGMVETVGLNGYAAKSSVVDREHSGSRNVAGSISIGLALEVLSAVGMQEVAKHEQALLTYLARRLSEIPGIRIYGPPIKDGKDRVGILAFNYSGAPHGLVAAVLNDRHNVALRNDCFCAQPYARQLLKNELIDKFILNEDFDELAEEELVALHSGMVRASLGPYTTRHDIDQLIAGLRDLHENLESYTARYLTRGSVSAPSAALAESLVELESPEAMVQNLLRTLPQHARA